jgi:hypothetical protein
MHRARAALTMVAAFLRAGEAQMLTQRVEQCDTRVEEQPLLPAIYGEMHREKRILVFCPRPRTQDSGLTAAWSSEWRCHGNSGAAQEPAPTYGGQRFALRCFAADRGRERFTRVRHGEFPQ